MWQRRLLLMLMLMLLLLLLPQAAPPPKALPRRSPGRMGHVMPMERQSSTNCR
jgi:hypothetical protein